jgi:DNA modification methylase
MQIHKRKIEDLILDPNNARKHSDKNLNAIKGSLAKFGQQKPIVINSQGIVIAGNGTIEAAKKLGWNEISCVVTDLDNFNQTAFALADNRTSELAEWDNEVLGQTLKNLQDMDFDISDIGFDEADFAEFKTPIEPSEKDDEIPEVDENKFGVKLGDLWILGDHRLMCGDSTNVQHVERLMGGEKADLWLTDPPYGVSYAEKNKFLNGLGKANRVTKPIENDHLSIDQMADFWHQVATNAYIVCSDKAPYYWFACQGGDQMMMMMSISRANWKVRHELIWVKNNHVLGRCDYHYKHEPILYGWKADGTHKFYGDFQTSVLEFPKPQSSKLHPTMKPVELIALLVQNSSVLGNIVFDTFLGSGTTLIACEKTGRKCYGLEIDAHYCSVIIERWQTFTGKQARLSE